MVGRRREGEKTSAVREQRFLAKSSSEGQQWQWWVEGGARRGREFEGKFKREAEAEPHGVAVHPYTGTSFVGRTIYGYPRGYYGKRSAEPHVGYGPGLAVHPGLATSYVGRTIHGLPHYGKRDAEAEAAPEAAADAEADADAFYGYYGYAPAAYGGFRYGWPGGYAHVSGLYGYPYWG